MRTPIAQGWVKGPSFSMEIIRVANKIYIHGNAGFYRLLGPKAVPETGRWLAYTVTEFEETGTPRPQNTVLDGLTLTPSTLPIPDISGTVLRESPEETLGSQLVIPIRVIQSGNFGVSSVLYLAARGVSLPVRVAVEKSTYAGAETLNYSEYNGPLVVKAPTDAVDIRTVQVP